MIIQTESKKDFVIMSCKVVSQYTETGSLTTLDSNPDSTSVENKDNDDSDEEKELTNLNWLLRNQTIAWPNTINVAFEEPENANNNQKYNTNTSREKHGNLQKLQCTSATSPTPKKSQCSQVLERNQNKRPTPAERFEIFLNKLKRDLKEYEKSAINYKTDVTHKPPFNYSHIIGMAMLEKGRITLQQICTWIESKFAFFRVRKKWNNSIRHNLSLHHCFRKIDRKREEKGKGGYWELGVDPKKCDRKRIRNRKSSHSKGKHPLMVFDGFEISNTSSQVAANTINMAMDTNEHFTNSSESMGNDKLQSITQFIVEELETPSDCTIHNQLSVESTGLQEVHTHDFNSSVVQQAPEQISLNDVSLVNLLNCTTPAHIDEHSNSNTLYTEVFPSNDDDNLLLQQQYELGTIIISTANALDDATTAAQTGFNCLINDNFTSSNVIYTEDEIPPASEDIIISSYLTNGCVSNEQGTNDTINGQVKLNGPNVIVEHLTQPDRCTTTDQSTIPLFAMTPTNGSNNSAVNCEYTNNFRPYIDGIDEAFQYLHSIEINRSEDILDNLLDVCVSDY